MKRNGTLRRLLSTVLALLFLLSLLPTGVLAAEIVETGFCGDSLTWVLDDEGTLTISGTGKIAGYAFSGVCEEIRRIYIPSTVTGIGIAAFVDNEYLEEIIVAEDNPYFCSVDGVLFTRDMETLISYPGGKQDTTYSVPSTVKTIAKDAFNYVYALEHVILPEGLTVIRDHGFVGNYSLESIVIPTTVSVIEYNAFGGCDSLTDVYYGSSVLDWLHIDIGASNGALTCATVHFDPEPEEEGIVDFGFSGYGLNWALDEDGVVTLYGNGLMEGVVPWAGHIREVTDFRVSEESVYYCAMDTALYALDGSVLVAYAGGNGRSSFAVPEGVSAIGPGAFQNVDSLDRISIPLSMTEISWSAFSDCSLKTVDYAGSAEDWDQIRIDWDNDPLIYAYASSKPGLYWRTAYQEWDPDIDSYWVSSDEMPQEALSGLLGRSWNVEFLFRNEDLSLIAVDVADLELPEQLLAVDSVDGPFCDVRGIGTGSGAIRYNGYSLPVDIWLPQVGFYSEPEARADTILQSLKYNGNGYSCYLIVRDGTIEDVYDMWENPADVTICEGGAYARLTFNQPIDFWMGFSCAVSWTDGEEIHEDWASVSIDDKRVGLTLCQADRSWDDMSQSYLWDTLYFGYEEDLEWKLTETPYQTLPREFLWRDENGNVTPVDVSDISFPETLISVTDVDGQFAMVNTIGAGSGVIRYNGSEIPVEIRLPQFGFYSEPEMTFENYLGSWNYTGVNDTVYLFNRDGSISSAEVLSADEAEISVAPGGAYAAVTIPDLTDITLQVSCSGAWDDGSAFSGCTASLKVEYMVPGLLCQTVYRRWDDDAEEYVWVYSPENPMRRLDMQPQTYATRVFLWRNEDGSLTPVDFEELTFPGQLDLIEAESDRYVRVQAVKPGTGFITCRGDSLPVEVPFPEIGFYSEPEVSADAWLGAWSYTGGESTIYLISRNANILYAEYSSGNPVEVTVGADGRTVTLRLTDVTEESTEIFVTLGNDWEDSRDIWCTIEIQDMRPGLYWRKADREWDPERNWYWSSSDEMPRKEFSDEFGSGWSVEFLFRDADGSLTAVDVADLELPEQLLSINYVEDAFCNVHAVGIGSGEIRYNGCSIPVDISFPQVGFYSEPEARADTILEHLDFTGEGYSCYLVARDGTIENVYDMWDNPADVTICEGGAYARLTFNQPMEIGMGFSCTVTWFDGEESYDHNAYIGMEDKRVGLAMCLADPIWDGVAEVYRWDSWYGMEEDLLWKLSETPYQTLPREFLWRDENGNVTPVDVSDISFPETLISVTDVDGQFAMVNTIGVGSGVIRCGDSEIPVEIRLPQFGFYSEPDMTFENYLSSWSYTGENDTVYLMNRDGSIENVEAFSADDVEISIVPGGAYAAITIPDLTDVNLRFTCSGTWNNGGVYEDRPISFKVQYMIPGLLCQFAYEQWNEAAGENVLVYSRDYPQKRFDLGFYSGTTRVFLWRNEDGSLTLIDVDEITFPEQINVVRSESRYIVTLDSYKPGSGVISYHGDSIPAVVSLPDIGFYSGPAASLDTWLGNWDYDGENNTIYLISRYEDLSWAGCSYDGPFDVSLEEDGRTVVIQMTDFAEGMMRFLVTVCDEWGNEWNGEYEIRIRDARTGLYWRSAYQDWDSEIGWKWVSTDDDTAREFSGEYGSGWNVEFLFRAEDGSLTAVDVADLELPEELLEIGNEAGAFCSIRADKPGSGVISYNGYSIPVEIRFPRIGFYSEPEARADTILKTLDYTGEGYTCYLIPWDGVIDDIYNLDENPADITISEDGTYAELRFNQPIDIGSGFSCWVAWYQDDMLYDDWKYIDLNDVRFGLAMCLADRTWDDVSQSYQWDSRYYSDEDLIWTMNETLFKTLPREFLWRDENGFVTSVDVSRISFPEELIAVSDAEGQFAALKVVGVGSGVIRCGDSEIPVEIRLPQFGFYSEPEMTQEACLESWDYTEDSRTVYLFNRDGSIDSVEVLSADEAEIFIAPGGAYAAITIPDLTDIDLSLRCSGTWNDGGTYSGSTASIKVRYMIPGLLCQRSYAEWDDAAGDYVWTFSEDYPQRRLDLDTTTGESRVFLWRNADGSLTPVSVEEITFPKQLEINQYDDCYLYLAVAKPGVGAVSCRGDSLPVEVSFPEIGFYSEPEISEDAWLKTWDYNGTNDTIYLISRNENIVGVRYTDGVPAELSLEAGGRVIAVHLADFAEGWTGMEVILGEEEAYTWDEWCSIQIRDLRPGLIMRRAVRNWIDGTEYWQSTEDEAAKWHDYDVDYDYDVEFLWLSPDGNLEPVDAADITFPKQLMEIDHVEGAFCHIYTVAPGSGQIEYGEDVLPVTVVFPDLGFYSEPEARTDTWIRTWDYNGLNDTIYLISLTDEITAAEWCGGNRVDVTIGEDGRTAAVHLAEYSEDEDRTEVFVTRIDEGGDEWDAWRSLLVRDLRPGLVVRGAEAHWDDDEVLYWQSTEGALERKLYYYLNGYYDVQFLWRSLDGSLEPVDVAEVALPGQLMETDFVEGSYCRIHILAPGSGRIECREDSIPVEIPFPDVGFYSESEATTDAWSSDWDYNGVNDTIYLISRNDEIIEAEYDSGNPVDVTVGADGRTVLLKISDYTVDWTNIRVTLRDAEGSEWDNWYYIRIRDLRPGLVCRPAAKQWDENGQAYLIPTDGDTQKWLRSQFPTSWDLEFLRRNEDGSLMALDPAQITFPEGMLAISDLHGSCCRVQTLRPGSGVIAYNGDTIAVDIDLPEVGFYREPQADADTWLESWDCTGTNDTIYLISRSHDIVDVESSSGSLLEGSIGADSRTVTLHLSKLTDTYVLIRITLRDEQGNEWDRYYSIQIRDLRPGLVWRTAKYNWNAATQTPIWAEDDSNPVQFAITCPVDNGVICQFLWRSEDGSLEPVNVEDLDLPDFIRLGSPHGSFAILFFEDLTTGYAEYRDQRIELIAQLPWVGFYSEPEVREDTWLKELDVTGSDDVFYLISRNGQRISDLELTRGGSAEITVSDDGTCAAITLTELTGNYLSFSWKYNETSPRTSGIKVNDLRTGLVWRGANRRMDDETGAWVWIERNETPWHYGFEGNAAASYAYQFLWRNEDGSLDPINAEDLILPDFVDLTDTAGSFALMNLRDLGSGYIEYGGDRLQVSAGLPTFGFYSVPEAREDVWLKEWNYTGENDVVYLVYSEGTITSAEQLYGRDVELTVSDSGKYVQIKLLGKNAYYAYVQLKLSGISSNGSVFNQTIVSISFNDLRPGLVWVSARSEWDAETQTMRYSDYAWSIPSHGDVELQRGYAGVLQFLWRGEDGSLTPVNTADLILPEHMVLTYPDGSYGYFLFDSWGTGEISYHDSSISVVSILPELGYYSEPVASEETWLEKWIYTGENRTIYLVFRGGTFDTVELRNSSAAQAAISEDGTYAAITLTDPSAGWIGVTCTGRYLPGGIFRGYGKSIELIDRSPLAAPTDLTAEAAAGEVTVSWSAVPRTETYRVFRRSEGSDWELIGETDQIPFVDGTAIGGKTYDYTVQACCGDISSEYDPNGVRVAVPEPLAITGISADKTSAEKGDTITWTAAVTGGSGALQYCFHVYRDGAVVLKTDYGSAERVSYKAEEAGSYTVEVFVRDEAGNTISKASDSVTVKEPPAEPLAITGISADKASAEKGDTITWTAAATGGSGTLRYCFYVYKDGAVVLNTGYGSAVKASYTAEEAGNYSAKVFVKDGAGNATSRVSGSTIVEEANAAPLTITGITADKTSAAAGDTITWTAAAAGGSGALRYCFYVYKDGAVVLNTGYGSAVKASYTAEEAGNYSAKVFVKDGAGNATSRVSGSTIVEEANAAPLTITGITADKTSAAAGDTITWTAAAAGGSGALRYCFYVYKDGAVVLNTGYGSSVKASYKAEEAGSYSAKVFVKDGIGHAASRTGGSIDVTDQAEQPAEPLAIAGITADKTSAGAWDTIAWTAEVTGGSGTLRYCFYVYKDGAVVLSTGYGSAARVSYTATEAGSYAAKVFVKDGTGNAVSRVSESVTVTGQTAAALTVTDISADKTGAGAGETITWTATVAGGSGTLRYCFYIYKDGAVVLNTGYGSTKSVSYTAVETGSYSVKVFVKDGAGNAVSRVGEGISVTAAKSLTIIGINADKTAAIAGETITWTGTVVGGSGTLRYCFYIYKDGAVVHSTGYGSAAGVSYTAAEAGSYSAKLFVKDGAGNAASKVGGSISVTASAALAITGVTGNKTAAKAGDTITWTGKAAGGSGTLRYCFYIYKDGAVVHSTGYGSAAKVSYTAAEAGTYTAKLFVKDGAGNAVSRMSAACIVAAS